jgi:signal transduction histidine kinase
VNAAGGEIVVESEPGVGSDFMIHIKADSENLEKQTK